MENLCNNCIHKDVCGRYAATWGMKRCENFMEMPKKGHWINEGDGDWRCSSCLTLFTFDDYGDEHPADDYGCNFCHNCGADMRGKEDGKE